MFKKVFHSTVITLVLIFASCSTTKSIPLDFDTLQNREFKISYVMMSALNEDDPDFKLTSYLSGEFLEDLSKIKDELIIEYGIELNDAEYLELVHSGALVVDTKMDEYATKINSYSWKSAGEYSQRVIIGIVGNKNEQGLKTFMITILKSEPSNPEIVQKETLLLNIE